MMIFREEFKRLVLMDKYDENVKYNITNIDENYFNNIKIYYQLYRSNSELAYLFILLSYNSELLRKVNPEISLRYKYKIEMLIDVLEDGAVTLLYDFISKEHIYNGIENKISLKLLKRISELNYNIKNDFSLKDIHGPLRLINSSNFNEYSSLIDYIIETFEVDVEHDFLDVFDYEIWNIILEKLLIKGDIINAKFTFNFDIITFFVFCIRDVKMLKLTMKYTNKISIDEIDLEFIKHRKDCKYCRNGCKHCKICKDEIELLSSLENFDDFIKNNYYFLMKVLDEEAINYVRIIL